MEQDPFINSNKKATQQEKELTKEDVISAYENLKQPYKELISLFDTSSVRAFGSNSGHDYDKEIDYIAKDIQALTDSLENVEKYTDKIFMQNALNKISEIGKKITVITKVIKQSNLDKKI